MPTCRIQPELIPDLVKHWREGYGDVYARRSSRDGESFIKRTTAHLFYRLLHALGNVDIPPVRCPSDEAHMYSPLSARTYNTAKCTPVDSTPINTNDGTVCRLHA